MRRRRLEKRRGKEKKTGNGVKKAAVILGVSVGVLAAAYLGTAAFFLWHFLPGTIIEEQDFSLCSGAEVEEYVEKQAEAYELHITGRGEESEIIKGSEIDVKSAGTEGVKALLRQQNVLLWPAAFIEERTLNLTSGVEYDRELLMQKVENLNAVKGEQTEPVSASPVFDGESFVPGGEEKGTAVDKDVLLEKTAEAVGNMNPVLDLEETGCYKEPQYTSDSPEVKEACEAMNRLCRASITYELDEPVVVDKKIISQWLKTDEKMQPSLDRDKVKAWLKEFGKTYDTVGSARSFTTADGRQAKVTGGTYGWEVDEKAELDALVKSIEQGETVKREPIWCEGKTAASHGASDWGDTYVEVDMARQHMWYVKDGSIALEADVVTGEPIPEKETPKGVYSILELKQDKVLKGEIQANGQREYETLVDYWMRVTWTGIGFHDATWQSAFGGEVYKTHGSHGCINMSLSDASALYSMLEIGTPVVIY